MSSAGRQAARQCYHPRVACPKCGFEPVPGPACPRCGIVLAKFAPVQRPSRRTPPAETPREIGRSTVNLSLPAIALLIALSLCGAFAVYWLRAPAEKPPRRDDEPLPSPPAAGLEQPSTATLPAPLLVASPPTPIATPSVPMHGLKAPDQATFERLALKLRTFAVVTAEDVLDAEALLRAYPAEANVADLLEALLISWSNALRAEGRNGLAIEALRRAISLRPGRALTHVGLAQLLGLGGDWPAAEREARAALALEPRNPPALEILGQALWRLGRDRDAVEALEAALNQAESPRSRALLARIQKGMQDERGMKEQDLSSFTVRYDGEAHEDVGREVLRALDRHFANLVITFDHRPSAPIPVILFTRETFYEATRAPRWSGGLFDNTDGRIRLPIGGLTTGLTPDLDSALVHELTHAFVADLTRGTAPRELHEGLAQYMEGKRLEEDQSETDLRLLADGRIQGVAGLYMNALALGEYLIEMRGQGGINDLLRAMGETRNVDEAFRRVYDRTFREAQEAAGERLRQRHGS